MVGDSLFSAGELRTFFSEVPGCTDTVTGPLKGEVPFPSAGRRSLDAWAVAALLFPYSQPWYSKFTWVSLGVLRQGSALKPDAKGQACPDGHGVPKKHHARKHIVDMALVGYLKMTGS